MLSKILAVITLGCLLPIQASAASWTLNTWVKSGGGSITVRSGAPQNSFRGSVFKSYTTTVANPNNAVPVTVTANTGYAIYRVSVNGTDTFSPASPYQTTVTGPGAKSVYATFRPVPVSVTATAGNGGAVTPGAISGVVYGQVVRTPTRFVFTPSPGFNVDSITGLPTGATVSPAVPAAPNKQVVVLLRPGFIYSSAIALQATFTGLAANAGAQQTVLPGAAVTLDGSKSTGVVSSYSWTQTSGPGFPGTKMIADNSMSSQVSFTPSVPGAYTFRLVVNGSSTSFTTVTVTNDIATAARNQCQNCHEATGVGSKVNVFPSWSGSKHRANQVMCASCHVGADTGAHPGPRLTSAALLNACAGCHGINPVGHPFPTGGSICDACHDPHALTATAAAPQSGAHFNNATSAGYPASYVTSRSDCSNCHVSDTVNPVVRAQWARSGHAAVTDPPFTAYDFKTQSGCVQCHTTTGFIAYSTGKVTAAWGVATDKTKEVITCIACHSDVPAGTVRKVKPVKPFADDGYQNRDTGESNVCFDCHSGRNNGASIQVKVGSVNFGNLPFVAPHYLAAGATLHGQGGYTFGKTYAFYSSNSHRGIGMGNLGGSAGPCVTCHMGSTEPHTFGAVATDAGGNVTAITAPVCANCHGTGQSALSATSLNATKGDYANSLTILKAMLNDQGYTPTAAYPYFSNTAWGTDQAGANVMGAAFNYVLLTREPGGYTHNGAYARQLVSDSIDAVFNRGSLSGSTDAALSYLVGKGAITQAQADAFNTYKGKSSCGSCHQFPPTSGSHAVHLAQGFACSACHNQTAVNATTLVSGTVTHLNGKIDVTFAATYNLNATTAASYNASSKTCANVYCHSGGGTNPTSMVWGSTGGSGTGNCLACHPVLSATHTAHVGDLFTSGAVTFYNFTANRSDNATYRFGCANCHPMDPAYHMNGRIDVTLQPDANAGSLKNKNVTVVSDFINNTGSGVAGTTKSNVTCSAAYCHSNGYGDAPTYATTPNWYGGTLTGDRCAACHGNSPSTGNTPGSTAHALHVVGIHGLNVFSGTTDNLAAGNSGSVGHGVAKQSTTLNCDICHADTVTQVRNDNNLSCTACHAGQGNPAQVAFRGKHINGVVDVSFKDVTFVSKAQLRPGSFAAYSGMLWSRNAGVYKNSTSAFDSTKKSLKSAIYDGSGGCSNVACHLGQPVHWTDKPLSYCSICHTAL